MLFGSSQALILSWLNLNIFIHFQLTLTRFYNIFTLNMDIKDRIKKNRFNLKKYFHKEKTYIQAFPSTDHLKSTAQNWVVWINYVK